MGVRVDRMRLNDVPEVMAVERDSFTAPWPASAYRRELTENRMAHYLVLRLTEPESTATASSNGGAGGAGGAGRAPVATPERRRFLSSLLPCALLGRGFAFGPREVTLAGYAGLWLMIDEAHVTTIGVRPQFRGHGYGELLLVSLIEIALDIGARWLTLEVRVTNDTAQTLYRKYGFRDAGVRKRYYSDNNEDALIMWTDELGKEPFATRYADLKAALLDRLERAGDFVLEGQESR